MYICTVHTYIKIKFLVATKLPPSLAEPIDHINTETSDCITKTNQFNMSMVLFLLASIRM